MNSLAGKTVLVTGATGFIGSRLAERLGQMPGVKLVLLSRNPPSDGARLQSATWIKERLEHLTQQVWNRHHIEHIDTVFHLGAFIPKKSDETDCRKAIFEANVSGTHALLESLSDPPDRIVFASTVDVYEPPSPGCVLTEQSAIQPVTLYSASKFFCEHLIRNFATQSGSVCSILRYGHIYGPGEQAYRKLIPNTIRLLLKDESPIIYGDGSIERDLLYVDDVVEATIRASNPRLESMDPINVCGQSRPILKYAQILTRLCGSRKEIVFLPASRPGYSLRFSNKNMHRMLGDWMPLPLENGLANEIEYFRRLL